MLIGVLAALASLGNTPSASAHDPTQTGKRIETVQGPKAPSKSMQRLLREQRRKESTDLNDTLPIEDIAAWIDAKTTLSLKEWHLQQSKSSLCP